MNEKLHVNQWRVLFFSPNAGLWQSSQLEHEFANGLAQQGAQVTVVRCNGLFDSYCPTMQARLLTPESSGAEKANTCKSCRKEEQNLQSAASYSSIWIDEYITGETRKAVELELNLITASNWENVERFGIPVGKYSTYLSMLHHKVPVVTATSGSWGEYLSDLKNSLYAAEALPGILKDFDPTHCVVYNPLYPTNRVFTEFVLSNPKIQYIGMSASGYVPERLATLALYRSIQSSQTAVDSTTIQESMNVPMSELEISLVARHIGQLVLGSDPWVYSTPPTSEKIQTIKKTLGIDNENPVAVVVVGSPDETRSSALVDAEFERVPINEVASVQEFIEQILEAARQEPNVNFVFRLHPRLAPNKRETLRSPDLDAIEALLADRPNNVVVNLPNDGIGLYDVARIAQLGINHASTAGLELLALGIPVIQYDPPRLNAYPPGLGLEVNRFDQKGLLSAIERAIQTPVSAANAIDAWRWFAVTLLRAVTHKSWTATKPVEISETEPTFQWLRNLLPEKFRERVSRAQSQRKRNQVISRNAESGESSTWITECITRMGDLYNTTIWNPTAINRGTPLTESHEAQRVIQEVNIIRDQISGRES